MLGCGACRLPHDTLMGRMLRDFAVQSTRLRKVWQGLYADGRLSAAVVLLRSSHPRADGRNWHCVMKTPVRRRRAVREMKEDPSEPLCRKRLQTVMSCFGQKPRW